MRKTNLNPWFTNGLLMGCALVSVLLLRENKALKKANEDLVRESLFPQSGSFLPKVLGRTLQQGESISLGRPSDVPHQIIFFFDTRCPYCEESMKTWQEIADETRESGLAEVIGVAVDSAHLVGSFVAAHGLSMPIVPLLENKDLSILGVESIPLTLLVAADGKVLFSQLGAFNSESDLDSLFMSLPGAVGSHFGRQHLHQNRP